MGWLDDAVEKIKQATPGPWYADGRHVFRSPGTAKYAGTFLGELRRDDASYMAVVYPERFLALAEVVKAVRNSAVKSPNVHRALARLDELEDKP